MRSKPPVIVLVSLLAFLIFSCVAGRFCRRGNAPSRPEVTPGYGCQPDARSRSHMRCRTKGCSHRGPRRSHTARMGHPAQEQQRKSWVILLHDLSDNGMGMIGYAEMLVGHGFLVLRKARGYPEPAEVNWRPMGSSTPTTFTAGWIGCTKKNIRVVPSASANRWVRRNCSSRE